MRPYLRKLHELFVDSAGGGGPLGGGGGVWSARIDDEMIDSLGVSLEENRRLVLELEMMELNRAQFRDNADMDQYV